MTTVFSIPAVSEPPGFSGEVFGAIADAELELACVQAYERLVDRRMGGDNSVSSRSASCRFSDRSDHCRDRRAVSRGHRGVIFPAEPMHLRKLPHINSSTTIRFGQPARELSVPLCFHAGSAPQFDFLWRRTCRPSSRQPSVYRSSGQRLFDLTNFLLAHPAALPLPQSYVARAPSGRGTFLLEYADHQYEQDHCDYA